MRSKLIQTKEQEQNPGRKWINEQFKRMVQEIDVLWKMGYIEESLDKVIELYDFLDYHEVADLRLNFVHPCMEESDTYTC